MYFLLMGNQIINQSALKSVVSKLKIEIEARIEDEQMKGSGCVFQKIESRQMIKYKTTSLPGGTYIKLHFNNKIFLII